jgi:starch phosphorylase
VESDQGGLRFECSVNLGGLDPEGVHVELFANAAPGEDTPVRIVMERGAALAGNVQYSASIHTQRPASDFTARLVPYHPNASVPLEADHILWQK